ncbi:MAG TPA: hypothetical protein VGO93_21360 [Candidatus Xenobia bacterium]
MNCGAVSADGSAQCASCGQPLPTAALPPRLEQGLRKLLDPTEQFAAGQLTQPEYAHVLDQREAALRAQLEQLSSIEMTPDVAAEAGEQMAMGVAGIQAWLGAIQTLRLASLVRDAAGLQAGVQQARLACDLLNAALTRNWKAWHELRQSVEETLPQLQQAIRDLPPSTS